MNSPTLRKTENLLPARRRTMSLPRLKPASFSLIVALLAVAGATCPLTVRSQDSSTASPAPGQPTAAPLPSAPLPAATPEQHALRDYSRPQPAFPNIVQPYMPQDVASPNLANTPRVGQLMHDGKLYLSIDDAIALAIENNLDLDIARYNLNIAGADILRAKSGASILGVNTGIVQNTPGGGVGGLGAAVGSGSGGTTVAAGGAGAGTNGLVSSTLGIGSPITSFDPILSGTLQMDRLYNPSTSTLNGSPKINTNTGTADF